MTVFDCILFSHEFDLLEIRLNTLRDVVDTTIIVESTQTHSGLYKGALFPQQNDRFAEFNIVYRCIGLPEIGNADLTHGFAFANESVQRKNCRDLLIYSNPQPDDIVLMGDLDEIPDPLLLADAPMKLPLNPCRLGQRHYYWWLNAEDQTRWNSGTIIMDGRCALASNFELLRIQGNLPVIGSAGWHFSSVGTESEIRRKMWSFCHANDFGNDFAVSQVLKYRDQMCSIHGQPLTLVDIDESYPQYLQDTWQDKYSHLVKVTHGASLATG